MDLHDLIWLFSQLHIQLICAVLSILAMFVALYLRFFVLTNADRSLASFAGRYSKDKDKVSTKYHSHSFQKSFVLTLAIGL